MILILFLITLMVSSSINILAYARENKDSIYLDEVVVEAEKIQEEETKDITSFVTVIEAEEYTNRVASVSELLAESVGVNVKRYGGLGSFSTISIRGSSAEQVAIFLDGVLLNQAKSGIVNLSDIPLDNVEKIEVYRGTSPAKFGGSGIGGVVNIITKKAKGEVKNDINTSYGSFNTFEANAFRSQHFEKFNYTFFYNETFSDGDFKYYDDNGTKYNKEDDKKRRMDNNEFESRNFLVKLGCDLKQDLNFMLSNDYFFKDQGISGIRGLAKEANLETLRNITQFKIDKSGLFAIPLDGQLSLFYSYQKQEFEDRKGEVGIGNQDNSNITDAFGGNMLATYYLLDAHILSIYGGSRREIFDPEEKLVSEDLQEKQKRTNLTFALEDEIHLFKDRIVVSPSFKYDYYKNDFSGQTPYSFATTKGCKKSEGFLTRKMGMYIKLTEWLTLKGNIGKYYRPPNFSELFGDRGSIVGNI
ncbi:MAG: TonB-dependent receptor, partial [Thermodesulfobacteriota bacterium]|nr:TonB-dependent receptor [Thermodesulfobacteriota bacterium]